MRELVAEFFAILNSNKFTAYADGVHVDLPTGETVLVKIKKTNRSTRPKGFRFSKFIFVTEVVAGEHLGIGYGEAATRLVALQKSIAEGVERALYQALKNTSFGSANSNGWAAHLDSKRALNSALEELLERDAVLTHWIGKAEMTEIDPTSWPKWLENWAHTELRFSSNFNRLRVLVSNLGYLPTVTTLLLNKENCAILSHATASSLEVATQKALVETCRIGHLAINHDPRKGVVELKQPTDHALYYAFHNSVPEWMFGKRSNWNIEKTRWKSKYKKLDLSKVNPTFHKICESPLSVGFCTSETIQNLFFGRTEEASKNGLLNFNRLKTVCALEEINLMPHWVP